ncbi:MAG: glycerol-3-phosphate 1-O-acyltransferase PlsY [Bacteroidia bacterium]|jgi:glycerol-3-phosphate acyltransferase PlsY|nr:glycerol-3-phosphate 1-O-acyltransferase PlsY [Bacteroidia bacterium]
MEQLHIVLIVGAYLLGSIPTAVWVGKVFFGVDVREHGSGNAGATNTLRTLGKPAGLAVLAIDCLKGFAATSLVVFLPESVTGSAVLQWQMGFGITAVIGHIFPIFARFKGGKGIATLIGMVMAMNGWLALSCMVTFVLVVWATRYISLGSMTAAVLSPLYVGLIYNWQEPVFLYFCTAIGLLVVYTHRANINRLISGNENKFSFNKKPTIEK